MNLLVEIGKHDFSGPLKLPQSLRLIVQSLGRRAPGGPRQAQIAVTSEDPRDLPALLSLLRCPVALRDPVDQAIVWHGVVQAAETTIDGQRAGVSLDGLFSRVKATYQVAPGLADEGVRAETAWAEDADALARYGRIEIALSLGNNTAASAAVKRDIFLEERREPARLVTPQPKAEIGGLLTCVGLWNTLGWRVLEKGTLAAGAYAYTGGAASEKTTHASKKIFQSFVAARTMTVHQIQWHLRLDPTRDDDDWGVHPTYASVQASLWSDNGGGQPLASLGHSPTVLAPALGAEFHDHTFELESGVAVVQGTVYHRCLERGDSPFGAAWEVRVDEGLGDPNGHLTLRQHGVYSTRSPDADAPGGVYAFPDTAQIVADVGTVVGELLSGVDVAATSGVTGSEILKDNINALSFVEELLRRGNSESPPRRLSAEVDVDRRLTVGVEPARSDESAYYTLKFDKRKRLILEDPYSQPVPETRWPAGVYVRLAEPLLRNPLTGGEETYFAEEATWSAGQGPGHRARGRPDLFDFSVMRAWPDT